MQLYILRMFFVGSKHDVEQRLVNPSSRHKQVEQPLLNDFPATHLSADRSRFQADGDHTLHFH